MIISYKYNFIYFRPMKTGSSTIEFVLAPNLGSDDVIPGKRARKIPGGTVRTGLSAHAKAPEVRNMVTAEFWDRCYRFASERHPYEKAVSMAYYMLHKRQKEGREIGFEHVLERAVNFGLYRGFDNYSIDGTAVVHDFIRHENFDADLRRICDRFNIAIDRIPTIKTRHRQDQRPAREILSDRQKEIVFDTCREEFELLGYQS